jgi:hypothetical protein
MGRAICAAEVKHSFLDRAAPTRMCGLTTGFKLRIDATPEAGTLHRRWLAMG